MKTKKSVGEKVISWVERYCFIPEGKDVGKKVVLRDWQKDFIRQIYDNEFVTRRAIFSVGRKNAKTALSAFLLLAHLVGPVHRKNSQLYSAAQSRDQAALIFDLAAKIVRMSQHLLQHVVVRDTAKQLVCHELGTKYKALSAEVKTSFGLSPSFIVHDELGQVRGPKSELYEALETATAAQESPLSIIISTQAPNDDDLLSILIDDAKSGLDPKTVMVLHSADPSADPFAEETVRQANPAFGDFQNSEEVLAMAEDARRMPSREADYRNLVLNQRVEASSPFITKTVWETCGGETAPFGDKVPIFAGLDLSASTDLTAFVPMGLVAKDTWHVRPTFWLPEEGLVERSRLDRVPYDVWRRQGQLMVSPGKSVEYSFVAKFIADFVESHNVVKIAFDRWGFKHLRPWLLQAGLSEKKVEDVFVEFGQGFASMSPALRAVETMILSGKISHGNHSVLNMCARNSRVVKDPAGNRKLDKARSRGRIDGMVALAMAAAVAESSVVEKVRQPVLMFV